MNTIVIEARQCPNCGNLLAGGALEGLCPACLLAQGSSDSQAAAGRKAPFVPPTLDEIRHLFPQLEIVSLLGAGGMGAVYKARQPALDRWVALKVLPAENSGGVNFTERFNREARALARLNHPNIVTVHEFGQAGALHFFIMEFVDGTNLRQLEQAGRLPPREALQIIPQICDALQYAHDEGVVHRDIKPENVLIDRKGRVKIADFGLAKILGTDPEIHRLTMEGQVMGTPHYMAPEQVEKPLAVDHRADIYALGVVFYEMLTGELPLGKFSPPSRKVQIDFRLDDVVLRALENDPARRYQAASEVKTQLNTIAATPAGASAPTESVTEQFVRWAGFRFVKVQAGARALNWPQVALAFAVFFGVLTVAFGIPTLLTGRSLWDWLGVVGLPSVLVRLALAAAFVAFGTWRALHREVKPPVTPQGTVVLPPERFSRKALIGAIWAVFFFIATASWLVTTTVAMPADAANTAAPGVPGFKILLATLILLPGFTAPFGTTILGWVAVGDIRKSRGRIGGLPLAVFDGLLFPLLVLDAILFVVSVYLLRQFNSSLAAVPREALMAIVALLCLALDFLIVRRVWRVVRLNGNSAPGGDWWWSRTPGAVAIGVACFAIILGASTRREKPGGFKKPAQQVAARESATGALAASLPGGARIELLAIADAHDSQAAGDWWKPDGSPHTSRFQVRNPGNISTPNLREKDFIFRFTGLRKDVRPTIESNPGSAFVISGEAWRDGGLIPDAQPIRLAWPERLDEATMRVGVSLEPWRTVSTYDWSNNSTRSTYQAGDLNWAIDFVQVGERDGRTLMTVVRAADAGNWQLRIVAADVDGVENEQLNTTSNGSQRTLTLTYEFALPLSEVKEFRAQVRPLHWVEFRDVALNGRTSPTRTQSSNPASILVASHDRARGRMVARLQPRGTVELMAVSDAGAAPNAWWNAQGEAMPDTLFEVTNPEQRNETARMHRQILLRIRDLPSGAGGPQLEMTEGYGSNGGQTVLRDGKPFAGGWLLTGSFPPGTAQAAVRLGFGLKPWAKLSTHSATGSLLQQQNIPGAPAIEARIHQVSEADGEAQLTMLIGYPTREWEVRIVAVDQRGREHTSSSSRGSHAHDGPVSVWSYKFWKLPLSEVKEFHVQFRPVEWIEFRDIPLNPIHRAALGQSTRPLIPTAWSAERAIHFTEYFDFDKGVAGVFPTAPDGSKKYRNTERNPAWARENGFDVEAGTNELCTPQMFIVDLPAAQWDTISIPEFERKMAVYYGPPTLPSTPGAKLPLTHGFRTADGAMGLLQITGFDEGQAGVRLRYKLLERAHFE